MSFYIIETEYVGPDAQSNQHIDTHAIEIRTQPARANMSGEPVLRGWAGTTNGWATYAHGEHDSLEAAIETVIRHHGPVRDRDPDGEPWPIEDENVVAVYRVGAYAPMSPADTAEWAGQGIAQDVTAGTTPEDVERLLDEYATEAREQGYQVDLESLREAIVEAAEHA